MRNAWLAIGVAVALSSCGGDDSTPGTDGGVMRTDGGMMRTDGGMTGTDGGMMGTDGGLPGDGGDDGTLTNEPATCAMAGYTYAEVANAGHYSAARLTPPRYPFTVASVYYTLINDLAGKEMCNADQMHDVLVFTASATTPPGMPTGQTVTVLPPATPTPDLTSRLVEVTLPAPVTLNAGEHLFVAVQMVRSTTSLCVEECLDPGTADRNWWSAAAAPPFPWATLASYGNDGTLTIGAVGD